LNYKFDNSLRKYPENSWIHEVLIDNISTLKEAKNLEIIMIFKFDTFQNGYNSSIGGDGNSGHKGQISWIKGKHHSEETKKKISLSLKGRKMPQEIKDKISKSTKGKKLSKEHKEHIGQSNLGRKVIISEETKKKMSESHRGKPHKHKPHFHTDESKLKMSKSKKGKKRKPFTEEAKRNMSLVKLGENNPNHKNYKRK
jgi:hypothetical protein